MVIGQNARLVVSRNRREGAYCGWSRWMVEPPLKNGKHLRKGGRGGYTLREWRHYCAN